MKLTFTIYELIVLVAALLPAVVGYFAWRRRPKPGATSLAVLLWTFALWALANALQLGTRDAGTAFVFYRAGEAILLALGPLWLLFTIEYTGRERWLTHPRMILFSIIPLITLVLIATNASHNLMWTFEGSRGDAGLLRLVLEYGPWFYIDLLYQVGLVVVGSALLISMLVNSQRLYGLQSLSLLIGFLAPWSVVTAQRSGLVLAVDFGLISATFAVMGFSLVWALTRYRLLDVSPVAHDAVVEGMSDGTVVLDLRNRIVDVNPAASHILGLPASSIMGQDFRAVMSNKAAPLAGNRGTALLKRYEEHGQANEEIALGEGPQRRHYDLSLSALYDGRSNRTGHLVVLHEITERKLAVEKLDRQANYDFLTGLPNRASFYERLSQEIARCRRNRALLSLFFLDLDRFKMINDTLGHDIGDLLLQETATRVSLACREYDVVSRLAGDEFTVILADLRAPSDATIVAERIVQTMSEPFELAGNELRITMSVGVCYYPIDGADPTTLVKNADTAMYRAKSRGKNRFEMFTEEAVETASQHLEMETELVEAMDKGQLVLFYQPEMDVSTSRMIGMEALLRWEHPKRGVILPDQFIPVAEETGLIFAIERWALREGCRQMVSWQERYPTESPLTVGVNLSNRHFMHPNLVGEVSRVIEETGINPSSLVLEIKESSLHEDAMSAAVTLQALKSLGVRLAVDNFGAGYSSLSHLKHFPLDSLKLDRSFVTGLEDQPEDRDIVSAVISLAHAMGLRVVAEGVENARQLMVLKDLGCDEAQGHYFAESLSHRATSAFLVADLYY
jgi:diguanylate cyclase (GGDEF)-like protein/PAS domain S-box-containing protein